MGVVLENALTQYTYILYPLKKFFVETELIESKIYSALQSEWASPRLGPRRLGTEGR